MNTGGGSGDTNLGTALVGSPHDYRIEWAANAVRFYVDGALVDSRVTTITAQLRPVISDFNAGGGNLSVDWLHMTPYAASGTFTSRVFDAGQVAAWQRLDADVVTLPGTGSGFEFRTGDVADPGVGWTEWTPVPPSGLLGQNARYLQYRAALTTTNTEVAPILREVEFTLAAPNREPTFDQDLGNRSDAEGDDIDLDAGASDADGDALTYAASGLPAGLSIDTASGQISGTIAFSAAAGSPYTVAITVRDGTTVDATDSFEWTVTNTNRAPVLGCHRQPERGRGCHHRRRR